jgi:hypothetical protein
MKTERMMTSEYRAKRIFKLATVFEISGDVELTAALPHNVQESDDNGAWVKAWMWVDFAGTDLDKRYCDY